MKGQVLIMRIKLYTRRIEFINGKEKLYRDIAVDGIQKDVEAARTRASEIHNSWVKYFEENGKHSWDENFLGINFKIKDLDSKQVIETFEMRF